MSAIIRAFGAVRFTLLTPSIFLLALNYSHAQNEPRFSVSGATVDEGAGYVDVFISSEPPVRRSTTIEFATASGTAVNSEDYWGKYESLSFAAGENQKIVRVALRNDTRVEPAERFSVRVFRPSDGELASDRATVTIEDDDGDTAPVLSVKDAFVSEGGLVAEVPIRLSQSSASRVQVSLATSPLSAKNGTDFYGAYRRIEIPVGETRLRVRIDIVDDAIAENDEQFYLRVFNASVPIAQSTATITIQDDDDGPGQRTITTDDNPNPPFDGVSGTYPSSTNLPPLGFPVIETTGVPAGTRLTPHDGRLIVTEDDVVIDSMDVTGSIDVKANNVTIKNTRVTGAGGHYLVRLYPGFSELVIEDSRLRGVGLCSAVVCCSNYTARRVLVTGCADGLKIGNNTIVEDSLITEVYRGIDSQGQATHNDGIQSVGGSNMIIRRNTILAPYQMSTSAIILQGNFAELTDTLVESNYLSGGSYTTYTRKKNFDLRNVIVRDNVFENNSFLYGYKSSDSDGAIWTNNELFDP